MSERTRRVSSDEGSVLIAVVGVMIVLSAVALGAWTIAGNSLQLTEHQRASTQALHVADAGLDQAMWRMRTGGHAWVNDPTQNPFEVNTSTGIATVTTSQTASFIYTITSVASSVGTPTATRTVSTQVFSMSLWNMILASGSASAVGSGGGHFNGNGLLSGPFYMRGTLDFGSGDSRFVGGPLFVKKGGITLDGNSKIGESAQLVDVYCDGAHPQPGSKNWYVTHGGVANSNVPEISLPQMGEPEMAVSRAKAVAESVDGHQNADGSGVVNTELRLPLGAGGGYKVVDVDGVNNRNAGTLTLTNSSPDFGVATDDFAKIGTRLYVRGTVFVDGPVVIGPITYVGNGTIVVNGNVTINGNVLPNGSFPSTDCVGCATPIPPASDPTAVGTITMNGNGTHVSGAWYAGSAFNMAGINQILDGSILSPTVGLGHNGTIYTAPQLPDYLPPSMPGGQGDVVFPSSWHEGRP